MGHSIAVQVICFLLSQPAILPYGNRARRQNYRCSWFKNWLNGNGQDSVPVENRACPVPVFPVNPYFKRSIRPFKTRSRVWSIRFSQFFPCFQPVLPVKPIQKIIRSVNYIIFDRDLTVSYQNPFSAVPRLCLFRSRGRFFSCQLSLLSVNPLWLKGLNREKRLERCCRVARLSSFKCSQLSIT